MLWLPSANSIYQAAGAPFPGNPPAEERAVLYDGLASRRLLWSSNTFSLQVTFSTQAVDVVGVAGFEVSQPLVQARARARLGSTWQEWVPLVIDGTTAAATFFPDNYSGVEIEFATAVGGTEMRFGEILVGRSVSLPTPSHVSSSLHVPTVVNGDFAIQVGVPRRDLSLTWPLQKEREIEEWVRAYAGRSGLLMVDERVVFGRLDIEAGYRRGPGHDRYEFGSISFSELEGGSIWQ